MAVIILFSNTVTSVIFKKHIIIPPAPQKYHSILELILLLMAGNKEEIDTQCLIAVSLTEV